MNIYFLCNVFLVDLFIDETEIYKRIIMRKLILTLLLILAATSLGNAQTALQEKVIAKNLDTPWELLWGPDNFIWMTERFGRISRVNPKTGEVFILDTIKEVFEDFERGLLGMELHPDFTNSPYLYVAYTTGTNNSDTRVKIVQYTYFDENKIGNPKVIIDQIYGYRNHDGSRLWIDKSDMTLYFTMGDAAQAPLAQIMTNVNGKLLRMKLDGTAPSDNPFYGSKDTNNLIWSYGHRNPQGLVAANGKIYTAEHGETTNDELNLMIKGRNYGWPEVEGFCDKTSEMSYCTKNNVVEPLAAYYSNTTIAPCGIDYYNSDAIPEWKNSILIAALRGSMLVVNNLDTSGTKVIKQTETFKLKYGRLRDVCVSPDGKVYIGTSNRDGRGVGDFPKADDDKIIEISAMASSIDYNNNDLKLTPLIANGKLYFNTPEISSLANITIFTKLGAIVYDGNYNLNGCDLSNLSQGVYFCKVKIGMNTYFSKFIN